MSFETIEIRFCKKVHAVKNTRIQHQRNLVSRDVDTYEAREKSFALWGAVCKKNYLEQICDIFSYLEIIKTASKFIYK